MESRLVVDGDLFARLNVAQSEEEEMAAHALHKSVGLATVVDVMAAVSAPAAVDAAPPVDGANPQFPSRAGAPLRFGVGARVFAADLKPPRATGWSKQEDGERAASASATC